MSRRKSGEKGTGGILAAVTIAFLFIGVMIAGIVVVNSQSRQSNIFEKKIHGNPEDLMIFIYNSTENGRVWIAFINQGGTKVNLDSLVIVHRNGGATLRNISIELKPGSTVIVEPNTVEPGLPSTYPAFKEVVEELRLHSDSGEVYSSKYQQPDEYMLEKSHLVEMLEEEGGG